MVSDVLTTCVEIIIRVTFQSYDRKLSKMEKWSHCLGWKFRLSIESFQCIRKNHFMYIFGNICVIKPFKFWECHVKQKNIKEKVIILTRKCFVSLNPITPKNDKHVTSPFHIDTSSSKQVMRILKLIR